MVAKSEEREVGPLEHVEESKSLPTRSLDARSVRSTISGADTRCIVEVACKLAAPVREAQLGGISEGLFAREQAGDALALSGEGLVELPVTNGGRSQNARCDGKTFSLIGVQQRLWCPGEH